MFSSVIIPYFPSLKKANLGDKTIFRFRFNLLAWRVREFPLPVRSRICMRRGEVE